MTDKNRIKRSKEQAKNKESIRTDGKKTMSEIAEDFKKIPESEFEHDPETKKMIEDAMKPKPEPERATMKMIAKEEAKIDGDVPSLLDEYEGGNTTTVKKVSSDMEELLIQISEKLKEDKNMDLSPADIRRKLNLL